MQARLSFLILGLLVCCAAQAAEITGRVVGVADGDTITVLDASHTQYKVRLAGIDAPEKAQPFGKRSKQHLSELLYRQNVVIEWNKRDQYGRIVGKVLAGGVDAGLEQIKAGMAWWFRKYAHEQSQEERRAYADAEEEARAVRAGLWTDGDRVVPPWVWRRR